MKRRFRSCVGFPPALLGAVAVLCVGAALLRAEKATQTRPAAESPLAAQTQPAAQSQPARHDQPADRAASNEGQKPNPAPAEQKPVDESPASAPAEQSLSFWELYLKGGYFMHALAFCSLLAVALIIERLLALRRSEVIPRKFLPGLRRFGPDLRARRDAALAYCAEMDSPIARILAAGIRKLPRGILAAEKAIEDAGANEALKLRRNMRFLYAIGSVATLLGLIGTIWGMIIAFQNAAASGTGDVHKLSTGIYQAMVNTFGGLAVAIVVTAFYYLFAGRIERLVSELNDTLAQFSDEFDLGAR